MKRSDPTDDVPALSVLAIRVVCHTTALSLNVARSARTTSQVLFSLEENPSVNIALRDPLEIEALAFTETALHRLRCKPLHSIL